jgi:outer membrane protein OmpA-like peptidoglycan-associated protein
MVDPNNTDGAPPRHVHIEKKKTNWLAWIALIAGLLALLLALSRCDRDRDAVAVAPEPTGEASQVVATTPNATSATALTGVSGLSTFLAGKEAAPRTFEFETLKFDTSKSDIRPSDVQEVTTIAGVLKQYANTKVRIAGYADARGSDKANIALGKARADAVKASLVAQGIDAARIETVSGGETDPVDSNVTASGQAENRRTELIVTTR